MSRPSSLPAASRDSRVSRLRTVVTAAGLAAITTVALTGCSLPHDGGSASASPTESSPFNPADAAAVTGVGILGLQQPGVKADTAAKTEYLEALKVTKNDPTGTDALDLGVKGNTLVEYRYDPATSDLCVVVRPNAGQTPGQEAWTLWSSPGKDGASPLAVIPLGAITCEQAKAAAETYTTAEQREQANKETDDLIKAALSAVPVSTLTPGGLYLYDRYRGFTPSPQPTASPTDAPQPAPTETGPSETAPTGDPSSSSKP